MSAATYYIKQGDRLPDLFATLNAAGAPINLAGATVRLIVRTAVDGAPLLARQIVVIDAAAGQVEYSPEAGDSATAGSYLAEFEITFTGGRILTVPNDSYARFIVTPELG